MKKILVLSIALIAVIALSAGGTWAYFNDIAQVTGNTITAGTLDLKIDATDGLGVDVVTPITLGGVASILKPGDLTWNSTSTKEVPVAAWAITNSGTVDGRFAFNIGAITQNENSSTSAETIYNGGVTDPEPGELGNLLKVAFWIDKTGDGLWNTGDYVFTLSGTTLTAVPWSAGNDTTDHKLPAGVGTNTDSVDAWALMQDYDSASVDATTLANLPLVTQTAGPGKFSVSYDWPNNTTTFANGINIDNTAQGDDCVFDITFTLIQAEQP